MSDSNENWSFCQFLTVFGTLLTRVSLDIIDIVKLICIFNREWISFHFKQKLRIYLWSLIGYFDRKMVKKNRFRDFYSISVVLYDFFYIFKGELPLYFPLTVTNKSFVSSKLRLRTFFIDLYKWVNAMGTIFHIFPRSIFTTIGRSGRFLTISS